MDPANAEFTSLQFAVPSFEVVTQGKNQFVVRFGPDFFGRRRACLPASVRVFQVYRVTVSEQFTQEVTCTWYVSRRYSDFEELHRQVRSQHARLFELTDGGSWTRNTASGRLLISNFRRRIFLTT